MLRFISLFVLLASAMSVSAQTVIDITSQDGTSVCSYPTNGISSSSTPGHLVARLSGTPYGSGCTTGTLSPPTALFTFLASNLTVSFTDGSTPASGTTITSYAWAFGDGGTSSTASPSHTYATGGTYSVTETVTASDGSNGSQTQTVTVSSGTTGGGGSCPAIASSTPGITNFNRLSGNLTINYGGLGNQTKDTTSFASVFNSSWPGDYNLAAIVPMPLSAYMSLQFTVPSPYFSTAPSTLYGEYSVGETGYSAPISMTISTKCGDFSQPGTSGSTVVAGCYRNMFASTQYLFWKNKAGSCQLQDGQTYFLNIINADISNVTASGGTAASSKNSQCTQTSCTDPLANGPGNWSTYNP